MYTSRFGNKYSNKKTEFLGRKYDSKYEATIAQELDLRMKAGEFTAIEPQFRIKLYVYLPDGTKADLFTYVCDFRCARPDGTYLLVEAKGVVTEVYRTKRKLLDLVWLPDHKEYDFEEVRQRSYR